MNVHPVKSEEERDFLTSFPNGQPTGTMSAVNVTRQTLKRDPGINAEIRPASRLFPAVDFELVKSQAHVQ